MRGTILPMNQSLGSQKGRYLPWIIALTSVVIVALIGSLVYGYTKYTKLTESKNALEQELGALKESLSSKENEAGTLSMTLEELRRAYALSEENGAELLALLNEEKERNGKFEKQITNISGTVGKLDKLSKLDPELLMKYSKVYFLNEHFAPEKVTPITQTFVLKSDEPEYISANVAPFLEELLEDAQEDGINLRVVSGYRSFDEQRGLKNAYSVQYGAGANVFSADQGYSEHQLGTTIDFTTAELGGLTGFENTEAYAWLQKHAHNYGFVLSYPKDNAYYIFEPWHWRFVGEDLADDLDDSGKFFYDLDQREIDEYLISIFD